jgi:hypothetical protein
VNRKRTTEDMRRFSRTLTDSIPEDGSANNADGCTYPGRRVARTSKFYAVVPDVCGPLVWDLLHVTVLAPVILTWLLDFWNISGPLC